MLARNEQKERVSRGSWALVAVLALCLMSSAGGSAKAGDIRANDGAYPAVSSGSLEPTTIGGEESEHLVVQDTTPADIRRLMESIRAPSIGSGCDDWADPDTRAGMLVPIPGATWLLVGGGEDAKRGSAEFSIGNLLRKYPVISSRRSGSPRVGEIRLLLREADEEAERRCVERLRGVVVQWLNLAGDPTAVAGPSEMVVRDVRFARHAVIGTDGESLPTGDIVVKLSFAESWISMVWREMAAQRWGIAGGIVAGVLLTILARIRGGVAVRLRQLKALCRSRRAKLLDDRKRESP